MASRPRKHAQPTPDLSRAAGELLAVVEELVRRRQTRQTAHTLRSRCLAELREQGVVAALVISRLVERGHQARQVLPPKQRLDDDWGRAIGAVGPPSWQEQVDADMVEAARAEASQRYARPMGRPRKVSRG